MFFGQISMNVRHRPPTTARFTAPASTHQPAATPANVTWVIMDSFAIKVVLDKLK